MSNEYTAESIKVLSDIEHIKLRPGMYIGEGTNPEQLTSEIIDNATDELQSGYGNKIIIRKNTNDNSYEIRDYGRGIPHGTKMTESGEEKEVLEILMTKCNSGGKFDHTAYKRSAGLHGVGLTVTNALSDWMEVVTYQNGRLVSCESVNGDIINLVKESSNEPSGTSVKFKPSDKYFESEVISDSYFINKCKILRAFGYDVEFYKDGELQDLSNITSLFDLLPPSDVSYCKTEIKATSSIDEDILVAINYTSNTNCNISGYTNLLYNRYGGTHTRLIYRAICDAWSQFYGEVQTPLKYEDCTLGLNALVAVFIGDISFSSQTKEKLTVPNKNLEELMELFKIEFTKYLKDNPELRKGLLKRFEEYRIAQNRLLNQKEIMSIVKINDAKDTNSIRRRSVVPGLIECSSTKRDGTEIFLVEGNSAAGPAARARDRRYQSVLPLRGKIKNATYLSIKDALGSETIRNIVNAIGAGVGPDADPMKSRYERIMLLADADPDGKHIVALILSTLVNVMPSVVKAGMVYVVMAPLYGYNYEGKRHYCMEMESIPEGSTHFTRYKGLGEMDDNELRDACLVDGERQLYKVEYPDNLDKFNEILGTSWGRSKLLEDLHILTYITGGTDDTDQ